MTGDPPRAPSRSGSTVDPPLDPRQRARGRILAVSSHPAGMTHRMVFTEHLPTLALVALGASETLVGLQQALVSVGQLFQLPTLRAVPRFSKRSILIFGQTLAVLGGVPLLFFATLATLPSNLAVSIALASLTATSIGIVVGQTVWFPLLRGYVEPDRIGRFFGTLRSGWHFALIFYYVGAQRWLAAQPGAFAPLFGVGWLLGVLRIALVSRLPERSERTGARIRVRDAFGLVRRNPDLRRYLTGVTTSWAVRRSVVPFAIVMLRREIGFSDAEVVATTVAFFAGGLVSLYLWGRAVDAVGPAPVFRWTCIGMAGSIVALVGVREPGSLAFTLSVGFFFFYSVLSAGFGVADTNVLFRLTPSEAPAPTLVAVNVTESVLSGITPLLVGIAIDMLLTPQTALRVYHGFFLLAAMAQLAALLPLRRFPRT